MIPTLISMLLMLIALSLIAYIVWLEKTQKAAPKIKEDVVAFVLATLIFVTCANSWTIACINIANVNPSSAESFIFICGILLIICICAWFYRWVLAER